MRCRGLKMKSIFFIMVFAFSCVAFAKSETVPTYYHDIAPLIGQKCLSCHGGVSATAPFLLDTYEQVFRRKNSIQRACASREMPPYLVDNTGSCNQYSNVSTLTDAEIALVNKWVLAGAPQGDKKDMVKVPPPELSQKLRRVDAVVAMKQAYTPVDDADEYRCFVVDAPVTVSRFLVGYDVRPGTKAVHHLIAYVPSDQGEKMAEALDAQDEKPGYACFGSSLTDGTPIAAWAPGAGAALYPEGTGVPMPANRKLILQVHYSAHRAHGRHSSEADLSKVEMQFEDQVDKQANLILPGRVSDVEIPAKQSSYEVTIPYVIKSTGPLRPFTLYGVLPHMHLYGTKLRMEVVRAGTQAKTCLMDVPHWDFSHQNIYFYKAPLTLNEGDQLNITCTYNTMSTDKPVKFGHMTEDEMCINGLYLVW